MGNLTKYRHVFKGVLVERCLCGSASHTFPYPVTKTRGISLSGGPLQFWHAISGLPPQICVRSCSLSLGNQFRFEISNLCTASCNLCLGASAAITTVYSSTSACNKQTFSWWCPSIAHQTPHNNQRETEKERKGRQATVQNPGLAEIGWNPPSFFLQSQAFF